MENEENFDLIDSGLSKVDGRGGKREGSGRKPGSLNKISRTVKENVIDVFQNLGGVEHMTAWAQENPNQFYNIYAKILPTQTEIGGIDGADIPISIGLNFVKPDSELSG